jgi:acyl-CoA synthetase (NDP forming)
VDLTRLLRPKSLAVLGGAWADTVERQCRKLGFDGPIWRIHPKRAAAAEADIHPDLDSLPGVPDAAFVGVNRNTTVEVMEVMNRRGGGGAVCFASGFNELHTDEARALTNDLKAKAGGTPFLGPNCYGFINFFDRVSLWPDEIVAKTPDRGVAFLSQSGTVGLNVMYADRSLPLGYLICVGNQTSVGFHDLIDAMLDDARVSVIGLYVEAFPDVRAFARAALRARERGVPIVAIKAGRSALARRTAHSHTGAMGGEDRYMDALFRRLGVARCSTLSEFAETCKMLHTLGPLAGDRLGLIGCSGGDMAMASDVLDGRGLTLPEPDADEAAALRAVLGERIAIANPLDFQTYIWHHPDKMQACFAAVMRGDHDVTALFLDHPDPETCDLTLFEAGFDAYLAAAAETGAKAVIATSVPEAVPPWLRERALAAGVAPLQGMAETVHALEAAVRAGRAGSAPSLNTERAPGVPVTLDEAASKARIAEAGVPVPPSQIAATDDAAAAAEAVGFPVVVKAVSADLAHKTEAGGVVLNLRDAASVSAAAARLAALSYRVLVEAMIDDAVAEMIVGVDVDPQFGPVVLVGAGGVLAELLDDSAVLLPPVSPADVRAAIGGLKVSKLLNGWRGKPAGDVDALIDAVCAVARFAENHADTLVELDINPLIVRPEGRGVVAADALIRTLDKEG